MFVGYTILVSLTFNLLTELSRILIKMHEGSKYVLQISPAVIVSVWMDMPLFYINHISRYSSNDLHIGEGRTSQLRLQDVGTGLIYAYCL